MSEHQRLAKAERAAIDLVMGTTDIAHARGYLDGYKHWFQAHPGYKSDLKRRMPDVIRWLENPK